MKYESIEDIKKALRPGDQLWIAEQLPGSLIANKTAVSYALSRKSFPTRPCKQQQAIDLALKRIDFNERIQRSLTDGSAGSECKVVRINP
jgi:hypothetical protein